MRILGLSARMYAAAALVLGLLAIPLALTAVISVENAIVSGTLSLCAAGWAWHADRRGPKT
jgi:hypothetical protein